MSRTSLSLLSTTLFLCMIPGCSHDDSSGPAATIDLTPYGLESTGQEHLIAAINEIEYLAERGLNPAQSLPAIAKLTVDSVYIHGEVTPDGYGAVVTERHAYPKGLLLITLRRSYGKGGGRIVTETRHYISPESFRADDPQQTSVVEMYALSSDTIVTYVRRNGVLETYTFRLPVITRTDLGDPALSRIVSRFGLAGQIVSETRDGNGALVQLRRNAGLSDGSIVTRTEYPDGSWRAIRTIGRADGSIVREITTGS